jgi:hypothetical protein
VVAEHGYDFVADIDGVAGEHGADFGVEWGQGFEDEGVGWGFAFGLGFELGWAGHVGRIVGFEGIGLEEVIKSCKNL